MDGYFLHLTRKIETIRRGNAPTTMLDELKSREFWRDVLAELFLTTTFIFIVTAVSSPIIPFDSTEGIVTRISLASGFMVAVEIQMLGHVSQAHFNPAVSISFAVAGRITPLRAALYVIVQASGGCLGTLILKSMTPAEMHGNLGANSINDRMTPIQGFGFELVQTWVLLMSILGCIDTNRPLFGSEAVGIGLTIAALNLAGIPYTGSSMNPARSFGPAVVSNKFDDHWIYWAGPITGGILGTLTYKYIFDPYSKALSYEQVEKKLLEEHNKGVKTQLEPNMKEFVHVLDTHHV
ncbi:aquaporin-like protein [Mactra antiquata]